MDYNFKKKICILTTIIVVAIQAAEVSANHQTLLNLDDSELSGITGQALLNMSYISPTDSSNKMGSEGIGFYKLGMEADVEINANINKLQLGCGGMNGPGCDIDIDNLSLSGISDTREGRAGSSAKLTNPFFELAIKNPDSTSKREFMGIRLSAEKVLGLLTLGSENTKEANGINFLSGYMKVQSGIGDTAAERSKIKGYANTAKQYLNLEEYPIVGKLTAKGQVPELCLLLIGCLGGNIVELATTVFTTIGGGFNIPEMNNLPFETQQIIVNGNRKSSVGMSASVDVPTIYLGVGDNYPTDGRVINNSNGTTTAVYTAGTPVNAKVLSCTGGGCFTVAEGATFTEVKMHGSVGGAKSNVNLEQALGFIHALEINSSTSLSLQSIAMSWPGFEEGNVALPGWWLSMEDPVNIGRVEPIQRLSIEPLLSQFAIKAGDYMKSNPAETYDLKSIILGEAGLITNIGNVDLSEAKPLDMNLRDLQLNGQFFAPNCYGKLTFC